MGKRDERLLADFVALFYDYDETDEWGAELPRRNRSGGGRV